MIHVPLCLTCSLLAGCKKSEKLLFRFKSERAEESLSFRFVKLSMPQTCHAELARAIEKAKEQRIAAMRLEHAPERGGKGRF